MRTNRLYTPGALEAGSVVTLGEKEGHYLTRVLRLSRGAEIILFNGNGNDCLCVLESIGRDGVRARVNECRPGLPESPLAITLCQAVSRGDRMDYSLQKATELGVSGVRPLLSERVEVKLSGKRLEKRLAHWTGVIQSASEQCGRTVVPKLHDPVSLHGWRDDGAVRLVLDPRARVSLKDVGPAGSVEIAVGPEGGFSDGEIEWMERAGVQPVRLGPRILRTETAGPAAIAVLQAVAGDLG